MESMLVEQHYLRSPLRPFADLDTHNNNLSLEEKALLAARSQLFLRAAAAAAGPYGPLVNTMGSLYGAPGPGGGGGPGSPAAAGMPPGMLWSQWACLGPSLLHQHQLAVAAAASSSAAAAAAHAAQLSPLARPLAQHRYSPYATPTSASRSSPVSSPDTSLREIADPDLPSPHSPS